MTASKWRLTKSERDGPHDHSHMGDITFQKYKKCWQMWNCIKSYPCMFIDSSNRWRCPILLHGFGHLHSHKCIKCVFVRDCLRKCLRLFYKLHPCCTNFRSFFLNVTEYSSICLKDDFPPFPVNCSLICLSHFSNFILDFSFIVKKHLIHNVK